jgi:pilus assembly protein CpaC
MTSQFNRYQKIIITPVLLAASLALAQNAADNPASLEKIARPSNTRLEQGQVASLPGLSCKGEVSAPGKLILPIGKSTLLRLPEPVINRTLGNPSVAQAMLGAPETLYLLGVEIGTTNMILQGRSGNCSTVDVTVTMDPAALQASYKELMPEETGIRVTAAADSLVLSGTVADALAVMRAVDLATAFVRRPAIMSNAAQQEGMTSTAGNPMQTASMNAMNQQTRIVNLLGVSAAQQVMLEVKIAEVSKTLLDKLGAGISGSATSGSWTYSILSNFLTPGLGKLAATRASGTSITIDAEKKDGLIKILAEPNIVAISGQEGSFLAGGKILIPVSQDTVGGGIRITLEEKEFGVGLKFTPTVLAGGRINLRVAPEVSELSREGVGITTSGNGNIAILPLITTRRASTTVQLIDGQSFAIGGLIKNNSTANIRAFPILGEIPIIGALFRSTDFQKDRTELVFIVTPRLVKPLPANYKLPTDGILDPSRSELFLGGQLEGGRADDASKNRQEKTSQQDGAAGFELK